MSSMTTMLLEKIYQIDRSNRPIGCPSTPFFGMLLLFNQKWQWNIDINNVESSVIGLPISSPHSVPILELPPNFQFLLMSILLRKRYAHIWIIRIYNRILQKKVMAFSKVLSRKVKLLLKKNFAIGHKKATDLGKMYLLTQSHKRL